MSTTFSYKVRDNNGRVITGSLDADNTNLVVSRLKDMGYVPISIATKAPKTPKNPKTAKTQRTLTIPGFGRRVKAKEVALFSRQFATLINAGVSLTRSLTILGQQTTNPYFAGVIGELRLEVEEGASLSQGLTRYPKQFNRLFVSMIRAGEIGGYLDRSLDNLSDMLEKDVELRRKIKSALTYPFAVLGLVLVIMAAMLLFVVPIFTKMYKQLGGKLPLPTRILVALSNVAVHSFPILILLAALGAIGLRKWLITPRGRAVSDPLVLKVPIFGKLIQKTSLARVSSTLATLIASGVPILEALDIAAEMAGNTVVAAGMKAVEDGTRRGEPMARSLEQHPVFPPMVTQMIAVGEETGAIDALLAKVASFLDEEVEATVNALTSLLEPLMITIIGSVVGATVISLYLPMFEIYKVIAKSG